MEENISQVIVPKKRPTFLLVLCILSLIGSGGLGLISQVYQYATFEVSYDTKIAQMEEALEKFEDAGIDSGFLYDGVQTGIFVLEKTKENLVPMTSAHVLFSILSLIGIFLMFKMKKNGFYLYTIVNLFWMLVPIYFIGMEIGMMALVMGTVIPIAFIILYAINLKHMD